LRLASAHRQAGERPARLLPIDFPPQDGAPLMTSIPDDPTPIISWVQPDGSCRMEWPDGEVLVFSKEEWEAWRDGIKRRGVACAAGWGNQMKVVK